MQVEFSCHWILQKFRSTIVSKDLESHKNGVHGEDRKILRVRGIAYR